MYSEDDINSAVAAGAFSQDAAAALRAHVSALREMPRGDEESFRLVTSFNDIFVTIGVVILLIAMGSIGGALARTGHADTLVSGSFGVLLPSAMVAGSAWMLAEIFTRRRRMALPSIVLLIAFVAAMFVASMSLVALPLGLIAGIDALNDAAIERSNVGDVGGAVLLAGLMLTAGASTSYATLLHWRRFMVPITVAAGAAAVAASIIGAIALAHEAMNKDQESLAILPLVLIAGLAIFALAMRWDISDRERSTRRSDVAFWLHLLAAPMIAHPLFSSLGVMDGGDGVGIASALGVIAIYVLFGLVALAIDRRALLVSALAYVLAALTFLFDRFGAVELNFALTALIIGSALLTLSAFWTPIRAHVVKWLPGPMQTRLPTVGAMPA